jgi:probable F420-dependent oxidoreductase
LDGLWNYGAVVEYFFQFPDTNAPEPDMLDVGSVAEIATALEAAGWHGLSFTEHPAPGARWLAAGGHQTLDPFVALGHAAAVTERLKLLTYLSVIPYRNPLMLAKTAATVDKVSNGRFILGVGTGYLKGEFRALGVDFEERNALFDEALDVLPLHWSGEPFDYEGINFSAKGIQARPVPVQQPIPIWIGGNAKITRRRVATKAQGWMPLPGAGEMLKTTRTPSVGGMDGLAKMIDEVKEQAGDRADQLSFVFGYLDPEFSADPTADVERHRDALGGYTEAGLTHTVMSGVPAAPTKVLENIAAIAELYFP